jgi:ADP-heptose:LPS heptosyltransferase
MKEILIVNLTRMGDLLQTTPLMAGLKDKYPESRITLVLNSAFIGICKGIPFIDNLIDFDMKGYQQRLLQSEYSLVENYRILEALIDRINQREFDLAINVTHSPISAILISLVRAKEIRGFTIDSEGHRVIRHPWMRYFFNVVPNRIYNPFHLVDMYLKMGDVMPGQKGLFYEVSADDEGRADVLLRKEGISEGDILIGMHLGASKSDKRWEVSSYAELANLITSTFDVRILLFGSSGEAALAEEFKMATNIHHYSFVGKTDLGELAALLKRCALFITNDTGPLHIATAVGTKVIDISTANVHFMETGPYGEGHYVIQADLPCVPCGFEVECKNMICKSIMKPQAVFEIVKRVMEGDTTGDIPDSPFWKNLQVYKSYFKEDGYIGFYPLIKRPLSKEVFYRIIYRYIWNKKQDNIDEYESIRYELSDYYLLDRAYEILPSIKKEIDTLERLVTLAKEGFTLIAHIAEEAEKDELNIKRIKEIWKNVEVIDNEIELIGYANPCFRPFTEIYKYSKEALEGGDLKTLAKDSCRIYEDLMINTANMLNLMKKLISFLELKAKEIKCVLTN